MIQIPPHAKIYLAAEPADFRKGIDGLAGLCRVQLDQDPLAGHIFIFRNRRASAIKVLMYDGQGFWLCQKRLSQGRFRWWPQAPDRSGICELQPNQVAQLIWNAGPAAPGKYWKKLGKRQDLP